MTNRSASDKLIWYFYQFDRSILKILELENESDEITLEWYEDIDTETLTWWENIQVKYYTSKKIILEDWSLSTDKEIGKSILQLLLTYLATWKKQLLLWYYHAQRAQTKIISLDEIKSIISNSREKITNEEQIEKINNLTDSEKQWFIDNFIIEIVDKDFDSQKLYIKNQIKINCWLSTNPEIEQYYSYWLTKISNLVCKLNENDRKISKWDFLSFLQNWKEELYNILLFKSLELEKYIKTIKKQHFHYWTIPKYERIFIIEIGQSTTIEEIKGIILKIKDKFYKRRENIPKPYIFIRWITDAQIIELKNTLWDEWHSFEDGYYFDGKIFKVKRLIREIKHDDPHVKIKFINTETDLNIVLSELTTTVEIYQFYHSNSLDIDTIKKHVKIFLNDFTWFNILFSN